MKQYNFNRKDFTTVNKSLTWQEWFEVNNDLFEHHHISHRDKKLVIPKMGGFWVLDEYHLYNWIDENCISCGKKFVAKYEEDIFCSQCFLNYDAESFYYAQKKHEAWLIETYGSPYGIRKPQKKEPQLKLKLL